MTCASTIRLFIELGQWIFLLSNYDTRRSYGSILACSETASMAWKIPVIVSGVFPIFIVGRFRNLSASNESQ